MIWKRGGGEEMDVDGGGRRNEMKRVWGGWKKRNEMVGFKFA